VELWPLEPITAPSSKEARERGLPYLELLSQASELDHLFETRPIPPGINERKVKEVPHPSHRVWAAIFEHSENRFEVRYFGDLVGCDWETGWWLLVPCVEGLEVPEGHLAHTYADTLEDAEVIAAEELERIVNGKEFKRR